DTTGSLGIAISEAVEDAATHPDTHYSLGSVLNHVLLHQTVIGLEAKQQLEQAGEGLPDVVLGSCGGGSNLAGLALPFVPDCGGGECSRPQCSSPAARARSPPPRRPMPSGGRSTRRWRPRRLGRSGSSCSTTPATACSTSPPTTPSSTASSSMSKEDAEKIFIAARYAAVFSAPY